MEISVKGQREVRKINIKNRVGLCFCNIKV